MSIAFIITKCRLVGYYNIIIIITFSIITITVLLLRLDIYIFSSFSEFPMFSDFIVEFKNMGEKHFCKEMVYFSEISSRSSPQYKISKYSSLKIL